MVESQIVWNQCSKSPKAYEIYLEPTGKSATFPNPTRWNSFYNCFVNFLNLLNVEDTLNENSGKLELEFFEGIEIQFSNFQ